MKNKKIHIIILIFLLMLTACSGQTSDESENIAVEDNIVSDRSVEVNEDRDNNEGNRVDINGLVFGMLLVEGTEDAITVEQAETLLPLWQLLQNLSTSNTAATEETEAIINQIASTLTDAQLNFVESNEMPVPEMISALGEMGFDLEGVFANRGGTPPEGGEGRPVGGVGVGGGPGGGGGAGGIAGGATPDPEQRATLEAFRAERGGGSANAAFFEILIELLEGKLNE